MSNPLASIASLFNRAPKPSGISISETNAPKDPKGKNPSSDPLTSLTAYAIETTHRQSVNKGLYAVPAWTFHELARTCSLLGDKIRFWKAQIAALEWDVAIAKDAQEGAEDATPEKVALAEKQRAALVAVYEKIDNFKAALKHLASARFNGYAALRKTPTMLQIVDPWNVVREVQWIGDAKPSMAWRWNEQARQTCDTSMPEMTPAEYIIRECEDPSMLELMRLAFRANAVMNFREKNLEEASKNQVIILTGANMPAAGSEERTNLVAALNAARKGESAVIAKGDPACPTEVHKTEAAKGLPFYNSTLDSIDQMMTKAVTGGMLTMLAMPTGIGSGASDTQGETLATLVADEAAEISETLQRFIDKPVLKAAGLLKDGDRALAFFQLSSRKKTDPQAGAQLLLTLAQAGKQLDDAQAGEVTGLVFETKEPEAIPNADLPNRARISAVADYAQVKKLAAMDAPFFAMLDELTQKAGLDGAPDAKWFDDLENAIRNAPPEMVMDSTALRDYLARVMVKAKEAGEKAAPTGDLKNYSPSQPRDEIGRWTDGDNSFSTGDTGHSPEHAIEKITVGKRVKINDFEGTVVDAKQRKHKVIVPHDTDPSGPSTEREYKTASVKVRNEWGQEAIFKFGGVDYNGRSSGITTKDSEFDSGRHQILTADYESVKSYKESKNPELKARHDAAYASYRDSISEMQKHAAKRAGFNSVEEYVGRSRR